MSANMKTWFTAELGQTHQKKGMAAEQQRAVT